MPTGGLKPAILSYENTIETMHALLTAMLAVDWLLKENKVPYSQKRPFTGLVLIACPSGSGYKKWTPLKVQAIEWALEEMDRSVTVSASMTLPRRAANHLICALFAVWSSATCGCMAATYTSLIIRVSRCRRGNLRTHTQRLKGISAP